MFPSHFNLIYDSWIKVIDQTNQVKTISLQTLLHHPTNYRAFAGDSPTQDLAVKRFILAILLTVYTRYGADNQPYDWIQIDPATMQIQYSPQQVPAINENYQDNDDELIDTWTQLYQNQKFSSILFQYLEHYQDKFNFITDHQPIYQLSAHDFNQNVDAKHQIDKSKPNIQIKYLNKNLHESGNTLNVLAPRTPNHMNDLTIAELVRWIILEQNVTPISDKVKVKNYPTKPYPGSSSKKKHPSSSRGWLYLIKPVSIEGDNIFETLMLNLTLRPREQTNIIQQPLWEIPTSEYIQRRTTGLMPDNLAELYTLQDRALYLDWQTNSPQIHLAAYPEPNSQKSLLEPMTTWKTNKNGEIVPQQISLQNYQAQIWRNLQNYIPVRTNQSTVPAPGVVQWIQDLYQANSLPLNFVLKLHQVGYVPGGQAASREVVGEINQFLTLNTDIIFNHDPQAVIKWHDHLEKMVDLTNQVINQAYKKFVKDTLLNQKVAKDTAATIANRQVQQLFETVSPYFQNWLHHLQPDAKDRDQSIKQWIRTLRYLAQVAGQNLINRASPSQFRTQYNHSHSHNIFIEYQFYQINVNLLLQGKPIFHSKTKSRRSQA